MRKRLSIGFRVLFAILILTVGPLAFVTAAPVSAAPTDHTQPHHGMRLDDRAMTLPASTTPDNPFAKTAHIIKSSGYNEVSQASISTTVNTSYSRRDDSDPLENQVRLQIHNAIKQSPGASLSEISEQTGIHRSTVRYHVRILEEEQLATSKSHRGKHRLYPNDESHYQLSAALNEDTPAAILEVLVKQGPLTVTGLATVVDRSPGTVSYHLDRLAADDLIQKERDGNAVAISTTDSVRAALTEHASADSEPASMSTASLD
jgi:DNA-binding transcriptional ArsR family regulator